jgi:excisionase family DNA binding protein
VASKTKARRASATLVRELPTDDDALLAKEEVAKLLGVTPRWVERALGRGDFPHHKVGKLVRIRLGDVRGYLEEQRKVGR